MDFHDVAPGGKAFGGEIEAVNPEGKVLKNDTAVGGDLEFTLEADTFAEEFASGGDRRAFRIADFEMEFAAEALCARGDSYGEVEEAGEQR
jgi:hypothetical protein